MLARTVSGLGPLRGRARRLLAVFPHPDDEAYGAAGALVRAGRDEDAAAVVLCLTRGEASSMGPQRGLSPEEVGDLRETRLGEVARILSLDGMLVGDLPDGELARFPLLGTAAPIIAALDALAPQVVIGHDPRGVNAHPDHIATHWALRHALVGRDEVRFAMLGYSRDVVEAVKPRLLFETPEQEIDFLLRLSEEEADAKEAALRVHEAIITLREDGDPELVWRRRSSATRSWVSRGVGRSTISSPAWAPRLRGRSSHRRSVRSR